jgi:DNA-binding CsgD family transcriptional regulator
MLRKFRQNPSKRQANAALVAIRPDLIAACQQIAEEENTTVAQMIHELLTFAIEKRRSSDEQLKQWHQLTEREREITALVWLGLTNPKIGSRLSISPNTVKTHIKNILAKFNVNSKEALREQLSLLDFSEWVDTAVYTPRAPTSTHSPHEANH